MPVRAKRACIFPGCGALSDKGSLCCKHSAQESRRYEAERGSAAKRGYGPRWQRYRLVFLAAHPLCAKCEETSKITPATVVDHIDPHKGDMVKFWNPDNHQPLCKPCHDSKTAREDGRWG